MEYFSPHTTTAGCLNPIIFEGIEIYCTWSLQSNRHLWVTFVKSPDIDELEYFEDTYNLVLASIQKGGFLFRINRS